MVLPFKAYFKFAVFVETYLGFCLDLVAYFYVLCLPGLLFLFVFFLPFILSVLLRHRLSVISDYTDTSI